MRGSTLPQKPLGDLQDTPESSESFVTAPESNHPPLHHPLHHVFIAVMGMTGAGKSSFIKTLTRTSDLMVGHGIESCTAEVNSYSFQHSNLVIHLLDTPGFNDTGKSNTTTLTNISSYLSTTHHCGVQLTGIIYLHRITDNRMSGSALMNINMLTSLCGDAALPNVLLVTTMWNPSNPHEHADQQRREIELTTSEKFWAPLLRKGATTLRHDGTSTSALGIVSRLLSREPVVLDIQRQLVDERLSLAETPAGRHVQADIEAKQEAHRRELAAAREELANAARENERVLAEVVGRRVEQIRGELAGMKEEKVRLQDELFRRIRERDERIWIMARRAGQAPWWQTALQVIGGLGILGVAAVATGPAALGGLGTAQLAVELGKRAVTLAAQGSV